MGLSKDGASARDHVGGGEVKPLVGVPPVTAALAGVEGNGLKNDR
jgi:hypothetical protein